jgi:hypothetical protein
MMVAAAAVAVAIAAAGGALFITSDPGSDHAKRIAVTGPGPSRAEPPSAGAPTTCGDALPARPSIPAGYEGPLPGPALQAAPPVEAGQYIRHWVSDTGSIELRWPADPDLRAKFNPKPVVRPDDKGVGGVRLDQVRHTASGEPFGYQVFVFRRLAISCQTVQVTVYDTNAETVRTTMATYSTHPFESDAPIVTGSETADAAPVVAGCNTPSGISSQNQSGVGSGASYANPQSALAEFLDTQPNFVKTGYTEYRLPDGSIAYATQGPAQQSFVTVVHVSSGGAGWTVDRWEASGC